MLLPLLLNAKGLDASDFIDVINALANIKKRCREGGEAESKQDEPSNKFVKEKEYVYPGVRTDIFIFKNIAIPRVESTMCGSTMKNKEKIHSGV